MIPLLPGGRRRRTYLSLLVAVILAGSMFLAFQLFTYEALDVETSEMDYKERKQWEIKNAKSENMKDRSDRPLKQHSMDRCADNPHLCKNLNGKDGKSVEKYHKDGDTKDKPVKNVPIKNISTKEHTKASQSLNLKHFAKNASHTNEREQNTRGRKYMKVPPDKVPKGVLPSQAYLYIPNSNGLFQCLNSNKEIAASHVNDDYCDCPDSSDEPGTAACPNARFYCVFQISELEPVYFPSSRVNDGICDCCDGSDEWGSQSLPDHVALQDHGEKVKVYQVPCRDRCDALREEKAAVEKLHKEGSRLREKYISAAKGVDDENKLYGPDGVFYLLSKECFSLDDNEYTYKVCPFKEVNQMKGNSATLLGEQPSWISQGVDGFKLKMARGMSKGCPGAVERSSVIHFTCGLEDKLLQAREDEICKYLFKISTPAAC